MSKSCIEGGKREGAEKPRYPLRYPHKLGIGVLLVLATLFLLHPQAYKKEWKDGSYA